MLRSRLHNLAMLPPVSPAQTLLAQPGSVDLWWFPYEEAASSELLLHAPALLTASEKERHDRFHFARDRKQFLATRLLVRTVLSRYVPTPAAAWRFAQQPHGKPYIESPLPSPPLHFNLSNTYGLVVCLVSAAHAEIGVDVESLERERTPLDIASHYFSAAEVTALQAQPWDCQPDFFYALWTLKESYIKARGLGLALPLQKFSFALPNEADLGISFANELADAPASWRFALLRCAPQHLVAVAAKTGGAPLRLRTLRLQEAGTG